MRGWPVVLALLAGCTSRAEPVVADTQAPTICVPLEELEAEGEIALVPDLGNAPKWTGRMWRGRALAEEYPDTTSFVRCRPCDCVNETLVPWADWEDINRKAFERLRAVEAPYPVAIIPGFHAGGPIVEYRLRMGILLLQKRWVGSLIVSGGHRRGGKNEARSMHALAEELAKEMGVDITDRVFVEPCAATSVTNLRNSLRMMQALGIRFGLLVTDSKMSGQGLLFQRGLENYAWQDIDCALGRMSFLVGDGPLPRVGSWGSACQPHFTFRNNPVGFLLPTRKPSIFWVSPEAVDGSSALDCTGGSKAVVDKEPDNGDPWASPCLSVLVPEAPCGGGATAEP